MIAGIGTDIVSIARIRDTLDRHGASFAQRILSDAEWVALNDVKASAVAAWLAKRWAAKEAFAKAAGTGMRAPLTFAGIGIMHDTHGKPQFALSDTLQQWLVECGVTQTHLSISDEREHAVAFVIFEKS